MLNAFDKILEKGFQGILEQTACPICPAPPAPRLVFQMSNGVSIWKCPSCSIMYASPRFTEESLQKIYETPVFINETDWKEFHGWSYERWKAERNRSYITSKLKVNLVKEYIGAKGHVLDVGCAMGLFVLEARKQGLNIEGLEPSHMLTDIARKHIGINVHNVSIQEYCPDHPFSAIVVWDVLEHLYDPVELLTHCARLSAPGGYIFIQVPNYEGLGDRYKAMLYKTNLRNDDFKHFGFPWHVYSFNRNSLGLLLEKTGYTPLRFESWSHHMKDGKNFFLMRMLSQWLKKRCWTDYIVCVARRSAVTNVNSIE